METVSKFLLMEYVMIAGYLTISSIYRLIRITRLEHQIKKESEKE